MSELFALPGWDLVLIFTALTFNLLIAGIFITTRQGLLAWRARLSKAWLLLALPLAAVFVVYLVQPQPLKWVLGVGGALVYMLVEFLLDFVFKVNFRDRAITHIPYILLEYIALFGLLFTSIAIHPTWGWIVGITFWLLIGSLVYLYSEKIFRRGKHPPPQPS